MGGAWQEKLFKVVNGPDCHSGDYHDDTMMMMMMMMMMMVSLVLMVMIPSYLVAFGSLPCLVHTCSCDLKSTSCIDLSVTETGPRPSSRPRVLLKAPTLQEMEEMNIFEVKGNSIL